MHEFLCGAGALQCISAWRSLLATDSARIACTRFMAEVGAAEQVPLSMGGLSDSVVAQRRAGLLAKF